MEEPSGSTLLSSSGNPVDPTSRPPEIAFFDVETTFPTPEWPRRSLLEFGVVLVCPRTLVHLAAFSTLVRPLDLPAIPPSELSRKNGITPEAIAAAPLFSEVADAIYGYLHGRVWAGHNMAAFDSERIREAFEEVGRAPPQRLQIIDSLLLLRRRFQGRTSDMQMATLATHFGLGTQTHRSLDDVRMNIEILQYCGMLLLLESEQSARPPPPPPPPPLHRFLQESELVNIFLQESEPVNLFLQESELVNLFQSARPPPPLHLLLQESEQSARPPPPPPPPPTDNTGEQFLEIGEVSPDLIDASLVPAGPTGGAARKIQLLHRGSPLRLCCRGLSVRFGLSRLFHPGLSFVVDADQGLCELLDVCDNVARTMSLDSGSSSDWRRVTEYDGGSNPFAVRLRIPVRTDTDGIAYATEVYRRNPAGDDSMVNFDVLDEVDQDQLFNPRTTVVDAYIWLDTYDFQQSAGI